MGYAIKKQRASYERYFEGYAQRPVLDRHGNVRTVPVYTAPYWMLDVENKDWIRRKLFVVLLALTQLAFYLGASVLRVGSNHSGFVIIPAGLSAACLLFVLTAAIRYAAARREMTIYDYRTTRGSLRRWSFGSGILLLLATAGTLLSLAVQGGDSVQTLLAALGYGLAGGIGILQYLLEERCCYRETENENAYC